MSVSTADGGCTLFERQGLHLNARHTRLYLRAKGLDELSLGGSMSDEMFVRSLLMQACEKIVAPVDRIMKAAGHE